MNKSQTALILLLFCTNIFCQTSEIDLRTDGLVFPRYSDSQKEQIIAIHGQCIYNTDSGNIECWDGDNWIETQNDISFIGGFGPSYFLEDGVPQIVANLRLFDTSDSFDGVTFTCPEDGFYHFEAAALLIALDEDIEEINGIISLGLPLVEERFRAKVDDFGETISISRTMYLEKDTEIKLTVTVFTGGPMVRLTNGGFLPNGVRTIFTGHKVGGKSAQLFNP